MESLRKVLAARSTLINRGEVTVVGFVPPALCQQVHGIRRR
jgi:hypothetical protein